MALLVSTTNDMPHLRRVLLRELAPLMHLGDAAVEPRWVCVAVTSAEEPRGGLIGLIIGAWLSVDLLWLPPDMRGRGLGATILGRAEEQALTFRCRGAYVATTSSAACRFYERCGYIVRLRLPDLQSGYEQVTLQKEF